MQEFGKYINSSILNSKLIGCLVVNQHAKILYTNKTFLELIKCTNSTIVGCNLFSNSHYNNTTPNYNFLNEWYEKGEILKKEWEIINSSGEQLIFELEGTSFDHNGEKLGLGLVVDRTIDFRIKKKQEEIIKNNKLQLERFTDHLAGIAFRYFKNPNDGNEGILFLSKGIEDIFEIEREKILKNHALFWDHIHPDDIKTLKHYFELSEKNLSRWECIYRIVTPSGKIKFLRSIGVPHINKSGTILWDTISIDITQQKEHEHVILENQKILDSLTNQIPGAVYIYQLSPDGSDKYIYLSKGIEDIFGVPHHVAFNDTSIIWNSIHPDDIPYLTETIQKSGKELSKWSAQYRIILPSGNIKHVQGSGTPVLLDDGTIQWFSIGVDISKQKEQEKQIEETKTQLNEIGNQIPGIVFTYYRKTDGSDGFTYFSGGLEELIGVRKEPSQKNTCFILANMHPEDKNEFKEALNNSKQNLTDIDITFRFIHANKSILYIQFFGSISIDELNTVHWNSVMLDITNRKLAEIEANISNSKLRAFIKSSPLGIFQIDSKGIVTDFWNPAAEQLFGWSKKEVINNIVPVIHEENYYEFVSIMEEIKSTKRAKQFQVKRKNKFDKELILEITAGPLFNENNELTDLLIITNNISELEEYKNTLETALKEKEILLQEIHHRVKNNLAIISGLLELQALKANKDSDLSLLIEARNRVHSIAIVHEQLYQDMNYSRINVQNYIKVLLKKLHNNSLKSKHTIKFDLKFDVDSININRAVPLGLLINELFSNSLKYAFKEEPGYLKLHFTQENNLIKVIYEDDGPGFSIPKIKKSNSIGWQLIETLLLQLDSEYIIDTNNRFMLEFTFQESLKGSQSIVKNQEINL